MDKKNGTPTWAGPSTRIDRPSIQRWYQPAKNEPLEGVLLWQDDLPGIDGPSRVFAIRQNNSVVYGVRERADLAVLRRVRSGCRVFIRPCGMTQISDDRSKWSFEVHAESVPAPASAANEGDESVVAHAEKEADPIPF